MSDDFTFQIKADAGQALSASTQVVDGLTQIEVKASKAGSSMSSSFKASETSAKGAGDAIDGAASSMMDLVAAAAAFVSIHELVELSDSYTTIGNRLRVVTTDQANMNGVMEATLGIANDTRTGWEGVANTYMRLSNVTQGLGLSQRQVLDLTKEMAMASKVSGASTQEATMAMGELTHAFATGALLGREYRVLMRDVPALMHELQVASGKTGSEFAEMGKHGKISAELLVEWFGKANASIEDKFAKTLPTISDMLTVLHNEATNFFGEAGQGSGVMKALSDATQFVAKHFQTFAGVLLGVGEALIGLYVIDKIIVLVRMLTAAIAANPIGALIVALTIGISLLRQFGDEISIDSGGIAKMSDVLAVLWQYIKELKTAVVEFVQDGWSKLTGAFSKGLDSTGIELSLKNVLLFMASFVDAAIGLFRFLGDSIVTAFGGIPVIIAEGLQGVINDFIDAINKFTSLADGLVNRAARNKLIDTETDRFKDLNNRDPNAAERKNIAGLADNELALNQKNFGHAGQIDHVNLVPEGTVEAFKQKFKDDWKRDVTDSNFTKDLVTTFMDKVDQHAKERVANQKTAGSTVSTATTTPEARGPTDAEKRAAEKLLNELRGVVEESGPITQAQEKIAHAQEIINAAMRSGSGPIKAMLAQYGGGIHIMDEFKKKLDDQLHPYEAMLRKEIEHRDSLKETAAEQKIEMEMTAREEDMKRKQVTMTQAQIAVLRMQITQTQELQKLRTEEQGQYERIRGPIDKYRLEQEALADLLAKNRINTHEYALAIDQSRLAFLRATQEGNTFQGGLERGWLTMKNEVNDLGTTIETTLTNAFHSVNNALTELVTTGKANWSDMIDSMMKDLTKLALQILEMGLIKAIAPEVAAGAGAAGSAGLTGFATGGAFTVGGNGATDSQVVAFRATPGEKVTVTTPGGSKDSGSGGASNGQGQGAVHVHNHFDRRELLSAINTPDGDRHVINVLRRNPGAVRSILQK